MTDSMRESGPYVNLAEGHKNERVLAAGEALAGLVRDRLDYEEHMGYGTNEVYADALAAWREATGV